MPAPIRGKVGLVGTGMVGSSFAYAMMQRGIANELILIDLDHDRAEGEAMDLLHGLPFAGAMKIAAGDYPDLSGAELVVLAAGFNQKPGQTRLELLEHNAEVFRDIVPKVAAAAPDAVLLVATNPVDLLTQLSAEVAGLPWGRVVGSGTILDTARFRVLLGEHFGVNPTSVHAYIIGEHGDTQVPVWSNGDIGGIPLGQLRGPAGQTLNAENMKRIADQTRTAAYEIIKRKRATYYAIGLGLVAVAEAILRDQKTVLTVSAPLQGQYGLDGIALSLPSVVDRHGIEYVLPLPLAPEEEAAFVASAKSLRNQLRQVAPAPG